ncbi:MAG: hypothetical protein ABI972_13920 [Acidobacteriota bacterium]
MAGWLRADWLLFRTDCVDIYADSADDSARAAMNRLEQLRFVVGKLTGQSVVTPRWPVRIVLFKPGKSPPVPATPQLLLQDGVWTGAWPANQPLPAAWMRQYAQELWESNAKLMDAPYEAALLSLLTTLDAKATHIQLGAPPPPAERTPEWALLHLLATTGEFQGRMRVLLSNLQQGAALDISLKNSYDKPAKEMMSLAQAHLKAGQFQPAEWIGAPINPDRDFRAREIDDPVVKLALATVQRPPARAAAFRALLNEGVKTPVTLEGAELYAEAIAAGSENATVWVRAADAEKDPVEKEKLLVRATEFNPRWAEPHAQIALLTTDLGHKIGRMKKAVSLEPRHGDWWRHLAEWQYEGRLYSDSAASFLSAARWATNPTDKARMQARWKEMEDSRTALEAADRKRDEDEKQAALEKLRQEALERIHAAERKANAGLGGGGAAVDWWDGPRAEGKAAGLLERFDCVKPAATLSVKGDDGKVVKLSVIDPSKVVFTGGGEMTLNCGIQKPARRVRIEYVPKANAKTGSIGEVTLIEFAP